MSEFHVIIPARRASTRLPDKPLADLAGRALVLRVLDRARAAGAASVHVATDDAEIAQVVAADGGEVVMTRADHASGTDRICEAVASLGLANDALVVNLQGDEPRMPPGCLEQVAALLSADPEAAMATLWCALDAEADWNDPNVVKLVTDHRGRALYFSRAPIPHRRVGGWPVRNARRHVGLYAYRAWALAAWPSLPPSELEQTEVLEQLRALEAGWKIACAEACEPVPPGIDTPEDLEAMRTWFLRGGQAGKNPPGGGL